MPPKRPHSAGFTIQVPPLAPLETSYEPGSPGSFSSADDATASRLFKGNETPTTLAFTMGAEIVDEERAKLVEALQETFKAHMNKKIASTGVDRNDFVEANIVLENVKTNLKLELKDIYNNLDIDDAGLLLILIEINSTLRSIQPESINETISEIVNERIPTSEIVRQATKIQRTRGGKTHRKHKTNKTHKTNRKHKTNRRKHRKTRKN